MFMSMSVGGRPRLEVLVGLQSLAELKSKLGLKMGKLFAETSVFGFRACV